MCVKISRNRFDGRHYVERKDLEKKLTSFFFSREKGGYVCFLKGKKGVGKSEILLRMIRERNDTLYYKVGKDESVSGLINESVPEWAKKWRFIILDDLDAGKKLRYPLNKLPSIQKDVLRENGTNLLIVSEKTLLAEPSFVNSFIYNSATMRVVVEDLTISEERALFPSYSYIDMSLIHLMAGGKAFILSIFDTTLSFRENIALYYEKRDILYDYFFNSSIDDGGNYINPIPEEEKTLSEMIERAERRDEAMKSEHVFFFHYLLPVINGKRKYQSGDDFFMKNYQDMILFLLYWNKSIDAKRLLMMSRLYDTDDRSYINVCRIMKDLGYMENGYPEELGESRVIHKYENGVEMVSLTFCDDILERDKLN